jgi:hypothetical protein
MIDVRTAIAGLYLWLLFGFLSTMVSCDIKRLMTTNVYVRHVVGIISFFLLFTVIETENELDIFSIWMKTVYIYFIFLLMTKSKWYFSIPVFLLLIIDQSLKFQIKFEENKKQKQETTKPLVARYENIRNHIYTGILVLIVVGFLQYTVRQYADYGSNFSLVKLLLHHNCKNQ